MRAVKKKANMTLSTKFSEAIKLGYLPVAMAGLMINKSISYLKEDDSHEKVKQQRFLAG